MNYLVISSIRFYIQNEYPAGVFNELHKVDNENRTGSS